MSALVKLACERYGKLDVLVNNAGVMPISPLDDLRVEDWEEMIDVNIKGVLYGIAAALPVFRTQGFGHFVNIASVAGLKTVPNMAVYSGTKFAVRAISEGLRQEAGDNAAGDHHFAWHGSNELRRGRNESDGQSPARTIP